ncbi:MAG TPA: hypothetical protein VGT02_13180 [Methylomirabilota bacterium]|jgi:hypothetical protein|nr:hypothetical protein [Methylomirabilota bacterium]
MAKRFLRSIVQPRIALTASADITPIDLPVNPLSFLVLTLFGTQVAETAAGLYSSVFDFLNMITALSVRRLGEQIIAGSLLDLGFLNARLHGAQISGGKFRDAVGAVRSLSIPLAFTRKLYWHEEAFPPSKRGELQFFMTAGALPASFSAMQWQLESVELIEDEPSRYLKYVSMQRNITVSGQFDVPLPIGNPILGALLFDPETLTTLGRVQTWGQVKLLKDNVEQYYPLSDWESLMWNLWGSVPELHRYFELRHSENLAAAYAQFANTGPWKIDSDASPHQWAFLDFDPLDDGGYMLETRGAASLTLRGFADTGIAGGNVRVLPVELVSVR